MKVLYFSDNTSDHNRRFLQKLSASGIDAWFLDPTTASLPEDWLPDGIRSIQPRRTIARDAAPSEFAAFLPEFHEWLREIQPDLVHAGPTHTCGYVTALSHFHPWLLMSWGSDVLPQIELGVDWRQATEVALSSADAFFCDCDAVRFRAKEIAGVSDDRIIQFPWGVEKEAYSIHRNAGSVARDPGKQVVISTRSWEPLYAIDVLLEAFWLAYQRNPRLRLLLLGSGSEAGKVQEFIRSRDLGAVVRTPGRIPNQEIPAWFQASDIYISCSRSDGTSISLLEAMATGLPVVVTDLPANREWVSDGENGWLAASGVASEFADRILRCARLDPAEKERFAIRSQRIVAERADWDRNFPKLVEMYHRLAAVPVQHGG